MAVPDFLQTYLWSYDLSQLDPEKNYQLIITQILNCGDQKSIDWLKTNYSPKLVEKVIRRPQRGVWFREKLRHCLSTFNLLIDPLEFEAAIRELKPRIKLAEAVLARRSQLSP